MNLRPIILDRYLFKEFVLAFIAVVSFCALLLLVASIFDRFSDILEYGAPMSTVVIYFLSGLPGQLMHVIPIASMLAVLFSVGALARTNEVLAMLTSGVHGLRLALPVIFGGILIVTGTFLLNEFLVPKTEQIRKIYELKLRDKDIREVTMNTNVFARGKNEWFYLCRIYSNEDNEMIYPTVVNLTPNHSTVKLRMEADSARFVENKPEEGSSLWEFENLRTWHFDAHGEMTTFTEVAGPTMVSLEEDLPTILAQQMKPDEMNYPQLRERIRILEARNQPTADLRTDLLRKITFPLGILVIMMIGFSFAVKSRAGTAMTLVGYGIGWAVAYYVINAVMQSLGASGTVSPVVATVLPTLFFTGMAIHLLKRSYQWHA